MKRRSLSLMLLVLLSALPLAASQFIEEPFDQIARESKYVVRAQVIDTYTAWDDAREVIYTYATIRVNRYFGEATGPDVLMVREVGGTVDGYTQEAIGFPAIRRGENVVLMLAQWEDSSDLRIHAFNQGKYLVRSTPAGKEILVQDPVKQGDARLHREGRFTIEPNAEFGLGIDEFAQMIDDARAGRAIPQRRVD